MTGHVVQLLERVRVAERRHRRAGAPERAVVMMSSIVRPLSSGLPSCPPSPRGPWQVWHTATVRQGRDSLPRVAAAVPTESDVLTRDVVQRMRKRGPKTELVEFS